MQCREFGTDRPKTVVLLHGGGLNWWNYRAEALLLQTEYHVVLPILDGHAGSDRPFTSIEDNAAELVAFLDERCGGRVSLIGGLSLGGQILLEMLSQRPDVCRFALVESAAAVPSKLTAALIGPAFGSSYGLIQNKRFARAQLRSLHMDEAFFDEYYRDSCKIAKADMIAFLRASAAYALKPSLADTSAAVHVLAGGKENRVILRSAAEIKKLLPACGVEILPGLRHGELSLNRPERYVDHLNKIMGG